MNARLHFLRVDPSVLLAHQQNARRFQSRSIFDKSDCQNRPPIYYCILRCSVRTCAGQFNEPQAASSHCCSWVLGILRVCRDCEHLVGNVSCRLHQTGISVCLVCMSFTEPSIQVTDLCCCSCDLRHKGRSIICGYLLGRPLTCEHSITTAAVWQCQTVVIYRSEVLKRHGPIHVHRSFNRGRRRCALQRHQARREHIMKCACDLMKAHTTCLRLTNGSKTPSPLIT